MVKNIKPEVIDNMVAAYEKIEKQIDEMNQIPESLRLTMENIRLKIKMMLLREYVIGQQNGYFMDEGKTWVNYGEESPEMKLPYSEKEKKYELGANQALSSTIYKLDGIFNITEDMKTDCKSTYDVSKDCDNIEKILKCLNIPASEFNL